MMAGFHILQKRRDPWRTRADLLFLAVVENAFQGLAEHGSDAESGFQRWRILSLFDGVHGLASDVDLLRQLLLRHLAVLEAQPLDFVADLVHIRLPAASGRSDS